MTEGATTSDSDAAEHLLGLSAPGDDWQSNACLGFTADDTQLYAEGYRRAAEVLARYVMTQHRHQDYLVYPIAFLYRHWLELRLESLAVTTGLLLDRPAEWPTSHRLPELWARCRAGLVHLELGIPECELRFVDSFIEQFDATDPDSTAFRYPITKGGSRSLPPTLSHINLRRLARLAAAASYALDTAAELASSLLDQKRDWKATIRQLYTKL